MFATQQGLRSMCDGNSSWSVIDWHGTQEQWAEFHGHHGHTIILHTKASDGREWVVQVQLENPISYLVGPYNLADRKFTETPEEFFTVKEAVVRHNELAKDTLDIIRTVDPYV